MPRTGVRTLWLRLFLLILILLPGFTRQSWTQPLGLGRGVLGGGKGLRGRAQHKYDLEKATTIRGQIVSLGSYGMVGWRVMPGMAVQGLTLKTDQGNKQVYLGPPAYVAKQKFTLRKGDTLEVKGFKVTRENQTVFLAARVTKNDQTLTLLDEQGYPLWQQWSSEKSEPEGRGSGRMGRGGMGSGGLGR
jgi:hypothetical protein